jgi:hypothetical protein
MSDCNVCLEYDWSDCDGPAYDDVEMVTLDSDCKCDECGKVIPAGETHQFATHESEDDDDEDEPLDDMRTCEYCAAVREAFYCNVEVFGNVWEDIRDYVFPELTTGSACFQEMPVKFRQRFLSDWFQWKQEQG